MERVSRRPLSHYPQPEITHPRGYGAASKGPRHFSGGLGSSNPSALARLLPVSGRLSFKGSFQLRVYFFFCQALELKSVFKILP
jgi:hypothetical protein